jgi:hypothetical protein
MELPVTASFAHYTVPRSKAEFSQAPWADKRGAVRNSFSDLYNYFSVAFISPQNFATSSYLASPCKLPACPNYTSAIGILTSGNCA